jgi:Flp pilus assembly protein TadG
MDENTITAALIAFGGAQARLSRQLAAVRAGDDVGVSTLEMVIIALGLMAVAGILVAAVTAAVTSRTNQLQ